MQTHDHHHAPKAEEGRSDTRGRWYELLQITIFLHEQNPAHGPNIRWRHERNEENNIQEAVPAQAGTRHHPGQGQRQHRRSRNYAYT
ncbi:hypothetical protein D1872_315500 [compost metagenome]